MIYNATDTSVRYRLWYRGTPKVYVERALGPHRGAPWKATRDTECRLGSETHARLLKPGNRYRIVPNPRTGAAKLVKIIPRKAQLAPTDTVAPNTREHLRELERQLETTRVGALQAAQLREEVAVLTAQVEELRQKLAEAVVQTTERPDVR